MQNFTFIAIFLVLALATFASAELEHRNGVPVVYDFKVGDKCPAQHFYHDCNHCICGPDGKGAACTLMFCFSKQKKPHVIHARAVEDSKIPVVYNYKDGDKCPDKVFFNSCNSCVCTEKGNHAFCTLMACPEDQ